MIKRFILAIQITHFKCFCSWAPKQITLHNWPLTWIFIQELVYKKQQKLAYFTTILGKLNPLVQYYQECLVLSLEFRLLAVNKAWSKLKTNSFLLGNRFELVKELRNLKVYIFSLVTKKLSHSKYLFTKKQLLTLFIMKKMCLDFLFNLILEPIFEVNADIHNYGFRKNRSSHQALALLIQTFKSPGGETLTIFEPSLLFFSRKVFFNWLQKNLPIPLTFKLIIQFWIKENIFLQVVASIQSKSSLPKEQSSIVSLLLNFILDGLENSLNQAIRLMKVAYISKLQFKKPNQTFLNRLKLKFIRFSTWFLIIGSSKAILQTYIKKTLIKFLNVRGMTLNWTKLEFFTLKEKKLSFLGYDFVYKANWVGGRKNIFSMNEHRPGVAAIPQRENLYVIRRQLRAIFHFSTHKSSAEIILQANSFIERWCSYFCLGQASLYWKALDFYLYFLCWNWVRRKHPKSGSQVLANRYFLLPTKNKNKKWMFRGLLKDTFWFTKKIIKLVYLKIPNFNLRNANFKLYLLPTHFLKCHGFHSDISKLHIFFINKNWF
uniref:RNA-directed DNA polymerase n=1 Tax=Spongospora subterranea TaxID=70186 RepID=A0A096XTV9_9EUKA|nr:RNA-directed DNA polymerase [Spongospora subterranea]AIK19930.1 RNA-directed DNA polymerase [Spongospora subterranea]